MVKVLLRFVFNGYADIPPSLFPQVVRPALADRGGFAVIIGESTCLVTRREGAKRLGVGAKTATRRERDDPTWPKVHFVHGRAYYALGEVEAWARVQLRRRGVPNSTKQLATAE